MNYPTINIKNMQSLVSIIEQAANDPNYLDPANCPYDDQTIAFINRILDVAGVDRLALATVRPERGKVGRPTKGPTISMDEVEEEINEIRKELASLKIEGTTMETSDRIQVIKTRAALIERVLSMKERSADVKRFYQFTTVVLNIMEVELPPKSRDTVMQELKKYVEA